MLHLLNTKHSSKCFPPYRFFWSSPDPHLTQQGSWGSVSQSSVTLAIFRQEATLLVLVGGRCWKGTGKGKIKGWGVGWGKTQRVGNGSEDKLLQERWRLASRGSGSRWGFSCFVLQPALHPAFSLSTFILLHLEPLMCSRGCAHRYSLHRHLVTLSTGTL